MIAVGQQILDRHLAGGDQAFGADPAAIISTCSVANPTPQTNPSQIYFSDGRIA